MGISASVRVPSYRRHKPSGQAVVTLNGRDHYLGKWNTRESRAEYDRLIAEWAASGRRPSVAQQDLTITELAARYWSHAQLYYRRDGVPTGHQESVRVALRIVRELYGHTPAADFGPLALKALRQRLIDAGNSRGYINKQVDLVRRMFRWAVAEELVPPTVYQALQALPGLAKGRSGAREPAPVRPVDDATVAATLPHLGSVVADMVRLQRFTSCRPGEVCMLRPMDVDTSLDVWQYRPASHKTEHHGRERVILLR